MRKIRSLYCNGFYINGYEDEELPRKTNVEKTAKSKPNNHEIKEKLLQYIKVTRYDMMHKRDQEIPVSVDDVFDILSDIDGYIEDMDV